MGKRSDFERRPRDFYPTPAEAVAPLLPHLPSGSRFIEPCAGNGALIYHLQAAGHACVAASDIEPLDPRYPAADALTVDIDDAAADFIITNPPWDRKILHPMIERFSTIMPTWLLFDADWIHTRQAAPYMPLLRKVVSVGRVKWIPGSKMTGKDNCAWHLLDTWSCGPTVFVGRSA